MVTTADFRRIALALPGVSEGAHRNHPDFRVGKTIFATLGYPDALHGMVKLTPSQQQDRIEAAPAVFRPAAGAWGRQGSTLMHLEHADETTAAEAIRAAWSNLAS